MERPTCGTCPYWEANGDRTEGNCRHNAPSPIPLAIVKYEENAIRHWGHLHQSVAWPQTEPSDWCGEHPDFKSFAAELRPFTTSISSPKAD